MRIKEKLGEAVITLGLGMLCGGLTAGIITLAVGTAIIVDKAAEYFEKKEEEKNVVDGEYTEREGKEDTSDSSETEER